MSSPRSARRWDSRSRGNHLYPTVAILRLASRFAWVPLPSQSRVFDNAIVIAAARSCSTSSNSSRTNPLSRRDLGCRAYRHPTVGGAFIAVTTLGEPSPTMQSLVALLGGTLAAGSHVTKAGTRAVANASPEPFSKMLSKYACRAPCRV